MGRYLLTLPKFVPPKIIFFGYNVSKYTVSPSKSFPWYLSNPLQQFSSCLLLVLTLQAYTSTRQLIALNPRSMLFDSLENRSSSW
jgi:hypothetical protein